MNKNEIKALKLIQAFDEKLDYMKEHLQGVIDAIYGEESVSRLEWHLGEVVNEVGLEIPETLPQVEKLDKDRLMNFFKELCSIQQQFLNKNV